MHRGRRLATLPAVTEAAPPPAAGLRGLDDRALIDRARGGDDRAYARLVQRHDRALRSLVYRVVGQVDRMDEVLGSAYLKAYRALPRLSEAATTHSWLYRVTYTACLDELRRQWRRGGERPGRADPASPEPLVPPVPGPADPLIGVALRRLPIEERAALVLVDGAERSVAEAADALDLPRREVSDLLERGRDRLDAEVYALEMGPDQPLADDDGEPDEVEADPADEPAAEDESQAESSEEGVEDEPEDQANGDDHEPAVMLPPDAPTEAPPASLADLTVPEHGTDFWGALGRRLTAARHAPAAPTPDVSRPPTRADDRPAAAADEVPDAPDTVDGLARHAARVGTGRGWLKRALVVVGLVVVVGAVITAAVVVGNNADPPLERQGTLTNEVAADLIDQLAGLDSFTGRIRRTEPGPDGGEVGVDYDLIRDGQGSYRLASADGRRVVVYDAAAGVRRELRMAQAEDGSPTAEFLEDTGLAAGPPDPSSLDLALPDTDLGLALAAVRGGEERLAVERERDGNPVWILDADLGEEPPAGGADAIRLVIDRQRLLPIEVTLTAGGGLVRRTAFSDMVTNAGVSPDDFVLGPPEGVEPMVTEHGFVPIELPDAAGRLGYQPPRPAFLPAGFELAEVRVADENAILSLGFRRGFERVVVSVRPSPVAAGEPWPDPFPRFGDGPPVEPVRLEQGRFRQVEAARVATPAETGAIWGSDGDLAFTVWGDLTPDELVRVAESLR